jgi:hypothetical protein
MAEQRLLDVNEAAAYLGTNPQCLRMRIWRGQVPARVIVRMGGTPDSPGRVYLDRVELDNWIDALKESRK